MTVLLLANLVPDKTGAFERFVCALGWALRDWGHTLVAAFAAPPAVPVRGLLDAAGVTIEHLPGWTDAAGRVRPYAVLGPAWRLVRRYRPDTVAVHFGNEVPAAVLALACRLSVRGRIRWIWHQRQQIGDPPTRLHRHLSRIRVPAWAGFRFVALYEGGAASLRRRGIRADRITVIPNGVPPDEPAVTGRLHALAGVDAATPCVVNVSSLIARKRVDVTLSAFAAAVGILREAGHSVADAARLVLIGQGPDSAALRDQAVAAGIDGAVCFAGRRNDVGALLSDAAVLLLSSDAEACPWAILEAMAASVPVIGTDAGAAAELIEPGVTGWIVPRGDASAMARHLAALLADAGRRERMGRAARDRWLAHFTEARMIERHLECYIGDIGRAP